MRAILAAAAFGAFAASCATIDYADLQRGARAEWKATQPEAPSGAIQALPMPSAPLDAALTPTRIAFGSCNDPKRPQDIFDRILAERPDLFLYIGDNVYGDVRSKDPALPELKAAYMRLSQSIPYGRLRASVPVVPVWDDHDYGLNDTGAEFEFKEASDALFDYVYALAEDDPRRGREGVYHSVMLGDDGRRTQIILLDTRYFRSALEAADAYGGPGEGRYDPNPDPSLTILGDAQWAWLADELRKPADLRILVSSIQVIADGHGWEAWRTMPKERDRLYALFDETGAENIVMLSGDRHRGGLYKDETPAGLMLYELTSSSLTLPASRWGGEEEPGPKRLGGTVLEANYGLVDIDWDEGALRLALDGEDGETIMERTVAFDEIARR